MFTQSAILAFNLIGRYRKYVVFTFILTLTALFFDMLSVFSLAPVIDILIHSETSSYSGLTQKILSLFKWANIPTDQYTILTTFFFLNVIRTFFFILCEYYILMNKYEVIQDLVSRTLNSIFSASWHFFTKMKTGQLVNAFIREMTQIGDSIGIISRLFASVIQLMGYLCIPFYISWKVSLLAVLAGIICIIPILLIGKKSYDLGGLNTSTANEFMSTLHEQLSSAKLIMGFANQKKSVQYILKRFSSHFKITVKSQMLQITSGQVYQPVGIFIVCFAFWIAKLQKIPLSDTGVLLFALIKIIPVMNKIISNKSILDNFKPSYEYVEELNKIAQKDVQKSGVEKFEKLEKYISLKDVSFTYPDGTKALREINVMIPKGKMIALVGASGSGKSTLIDAIIGFNEPQKGEIFVDGKRLFDYSINSFRKKIGIVPQDDFLFNMSINDNLKWSNEEATEEALKEACEIANAKEFIEELPSAFKTIVGEKGVRLSGGQRQRISLARAILRNPEILILDEATSSLDSGSEKQIQAAIDNIARRTTVIVIAHRLSTIINADYIYVLDKGRIIEEGTYGQLVKNKGFFNEIVKQQNLQ